MRTTVTLDADVEQLIRERMHREGVSFKAALNDAVRAGTTATHQPRVDFSTRSLSLGRPALDLDRSSQLAAEIEDEEIVGKMHAGS